MTSKEKITERIKKKELELEKLKNQLKETENKDFQTINYKGKEYRLYKWENKQFKDFIMPEGFKWCSAFDLIELINDEKLTEQYPVSYYSDKLFKEGHYELFRAYLCLHGWYAYVDSLAGSYDDGRVVLVKIKEEMR